MNIRFPLKRTLGEKLRRRSRQRKFSRDFAKFKDLMGDSQQRFPLHWDDRYPCLDDDTEFTEFDRHYVYHLAWAARKLAESRPAVHVDISSSLHFCTIISAFIPVRFYDYRPAELGLSNLTTESANLLSLPFTDHSVESLSCMHVVEHIGLGRYGDPLDPDGDIKAMAELERVLAVDGTLLFVVPVGKPKIIFNAHRIYAYEQVINRFQLELLEFALIPDGSNSRGLIYNATAEMVEAQNYGCGCFWFKKSH